MAGTVKDVGARVLARLYKCREFPELAEKTGTVKEVREDGVIVITWPEVGEREMRASHIMLDRSTGDQAGGKSEGSDVSGTSASSDQSTKVAKDSQKTSSDRSQSPAETRQPKIVVDNLSERQRLARHLLDPTNPAFGGGPDHVHHGPKRSESAIRGASTEDLRAWDELAAQDTTEKTAVSA
jgi:hypothetical protein